MRLIRCSTGIAMAALMAPMMLGAAAVAQTAPQAASPAAPIPAAGTPAPTQAPAAVSQFQLQDGIVASVNDQIITGFDLRQRMLMVIAMSQIQPTQENLPGIQQQALSSLIEERLQAEELRTYEDLVIGDPEVDAEIAGMAQEAGTTPDQYLAFLEQGGIQRTHLREQIRTEIGWRALVQGRFRDRSRVSRAQVEQSLRQINEAASKPQYLIGEIYLEAARVGGQQAALDGANQLVAQLQQGAPFQAVAQQFSAAPSAASRTPGDAGWIVQGTVQPALQTAFDALQVGQLSRPIPVDGGVYIVYMRDKRTGAATNLVQMKQVVVELPETAPAADVAAATARLEALRPQLTCDNMLARATSEQGLLGTDLGESDIANLAPQFQQVATGAAVGTISAPVRTPLGLHLLGICGRRQGGPDAPTFQQVENRLQNQNLANLARRYIRDLRSDALIELKE